MVLMKTFPHSHSHGVNIVMVFMKTFSLFSFSQNQYWCSWKHFPHSQSHGINIVMIFMKTFRWEAKLVTGGKMSPSYAQGWILKLKSCWFLNISQNREMFFSAKPVPTWPPSSILPTRCLWLLNNIFSDKIWTFTSNLYQYWWHAMIMISQRRTRTSSLARDWWSLLTTGQSASTCTL